MKELQQLTDTNKPNVTIQKLTDKKEDNNMYNIFTNEQLVAALIAGGIPKNIADDIELVWPIDSGIRREIEAENVEAFTMIKGIGEKRAQRIIEILKGRIPAPMSKPCPDVKKPDVEMHNVTEFTLVYNNGMAKLTKKKVDRDGQPILENNEPVMNIAKKRFGPALQKLQQIADKKDNIVFTTVSEVQEDYKDPDKAYKLEAFWKNTCQNGIKLSGNNHAEPLIMGTNAKMKCQVHWADSRYIAEVKKWVACGASFDTAQKIAKIEAYFGLLLPFTHDLLNGVLNPDMEVIIKSFENEHDGANVMIDPDGSMKKLVKFLVNEFDGMVMIELTDKLIGKMHLNRHERRQLMRAIKTFNGGTLRGPWHKGAIVYGFHWHDLLHEMGVHTINGKDIDDIAMIGDKSVFKASIGDDGLYTKFEDFTTSFKAMQHRFGVLLENHGVKESFLPAQQLQAAHGANKKYIEQGAAEEVAYLNAAKDPKEAAIRYAPKVIAEIAQVEPSIMNTWFATELVNNGYVKEYTAALAGRTHGNSVTGFCIKDPVAMCEWIAYLEGKRTELPKGAIGKYVVYAPTAGFTGEAVASRNPVIANYGLHVVDVVDSLGEYDKYFDDGFDYIVVGIHDDLCMLLRMDHDGDKARLTNAKWFVNAVKSIPPYEAFANWDGFGKADVCLVNRDNEKRFFSTCTATPTLGLNVDTCSKMIANGLINKPEHEMVIDYLMNKGTDVKQGADGSNVSGEAGVIWQSLQKSAEKSKYSIAQAIGKGLKKRPAKKDKIADSYGDSNLDIISQAVAKNARKQLRFEGEFDVTNVLKNRLRQVKGLCGSGTSEQDFADAGLFDRLVSRNRKEWDEIDQESSKNGWAEWIAWKRQEALHEMTEYAENMGLTFADVYDAVTTYVFVTLRKTWFGQNTSDGKRKRIILIARTYLEWFGNEMEETFCANRALGILKTVQGPVDTEEPVW